MDTPQQYKILLVDFGREIDKRDSKKFDQAVENLKEDLEEWCATNGVYATLESGTVTLRGGRPPPFPQKATQVHVVFEEDVDYAMYKLTITENFKPTSEMVYNTDGKWQFKFRYQDQYDPYQPNTPI